MDYWVATCSTGTVATGSSSSPGEIIPAIAPTSPEFAPALGGIGSLDLLSIFRGHNFDPTLVMPQAKAPSD
jgi:hypothetical protein